MLNQQCQSTEGKCVYILQYLEICQQLVLPAATLPLYPGMVKGKGKGFPFSIQSVGPGADPGVQAVSLQVTVKSSARR